MRKLILALLVLQCSGCSPETLAVAHLGPKTLDLVDARGSIEKHGDGLTIQLTGWENPSCAGSDDETAVRVTITVPTISSVPLGVPIAVSGANPPLEVKLQMGAMGSLCSGDCSNPHFTLSGTITFDTLSPNAATGAIDLHLKGDVINIDSSPPTSFARDTKLDLSWEGFQVPVNVDHC